MAADRTGGRGSQTVGYRGPDREAITPGWPCRHIPLADGRADFDSQPCTRRPMPSSGALLRSVS